MATQYQIVQSSTGKELERLVNALLRQGWEAQGGISVIQRHSRDAMPDSEETIYTQAVVKYWK